MANPTVFTARALLIDMDGTLVNSDAAVERVWRRWADQNGLNGDEVVRVAHGRQGQATMAILLPDRPVEQNLAENAWILSEETADVEGVVAVPGAAEFLASLLEGVSHALVTSANAALSAARMGAAGLPLPKIRVTAESVTASKPHPEGFLKAAEELGVAAADCLVFEDSGAGIAAGRAAGMRVVGIGSRAHLHSPDVTALDLTVVRVEVAGDGLFRVHVG